MRPEGLWQRQAAALTGNGGLFYMTFSCPKPLWVNQGHPHLLLPRPPEKGKDKGKSK